MDEHSATHTKELESIKKTELKNTTTEIKNMLEGIISRIGDMKEQIRELQDRVVGVPKVQKKKKGLKKLE